MNADGYSTKVFLGDPAHVRMRQTEPLQTRLDSVQSLIDERGAVELLIARGCLWEERREEKHVVCSCHTHSHKWPIRMAVTVPEHPRRTVRARPIIHGCARVRVCVCVCVCVCARASARVYTTGVLTYRDSSNGWPSSTPSQERLRRPEFVLECVPAESHKSGDSVFRRDCAAMMQLAICG
jgi:hypothetical protein